MRTMKCVGWSLLAAIVLCCMYDTSSPALAIGTHSRVHVAELTYPGATRTRPSALKRLMWEVSKRTSLRPHMQPVRISVRDKNLFRYPLLTLSGEKGFAPWPAQDVMRLRSHLAAGGTLFLDMASGSVGSPFDRSVRRLVKRLFPKRTLQKLPQKHTLFRSFYLIRRFGGRVLQRAYLEGVMLDDRSPILYSVNDLQGAWERDNFGNWVHPVLPGGRSQREHAFRLGLNIVFYALCVNYKQDLVHVPFIMKRRK